MKAAAAALALAAARPAAAVALGLPHGHGGDRRLRGPALAELPGGHSVADRTSSGHCLDDEADWVSRAGSSCTDYQTRSWCTLDGGYGEGWGEHGGTFHDFAVRGVSANRACCACGGGRKVSLSLAAAGAGACAEGSAIADAGTCRAAAASLEIRYHDSERAPRGHARGCHTDGSRSQVWFNGDEAAENDGKFSLLCMQEAQASDDDDDDDEDDDDKDDKHDKDEHPEQTGTAAAFAALREAVARTHDSLAQNMRDRVAVTSELHKLQDSAADPREVEDGVQSVQEETKSSAMAGLLGDMWKEMRMFATPFYEERLLEKQEALKRHEPVLQAAYDRARRELEVFSAEHRDGK